MEDIQAKIKSAVTTITSDSELITKFKADPTGTVKEVVGEQMPTDIIETIKTMIANKLGVTTTTTTAATAEEAASQSKCCLLL